MVEKIHKGMNKCINTKSKNEWRMNIMRDERLDVEINKWIKKYVKR